ncbi:uncharacterized protein zgc:194621 isoform X2 [Chiloscyllium plagiosum]|uniref:uncharacterized protein zgc:194621 isoform X2 n=1 Tax=Chiloscyllium plagiosum TaxID=36176 RepID=UPI001CB80E29|nr:uncharacterized protein zgc:194621 isoform X2 [Chiloscyllium plagiosum]
MSYSVLSKPRIIRAKLGNDDHDERGAVGKDGAGTQKVQVKSTGVRKGTASSKDTGTTTGKGVGKNIDTCTAEGSTTVLRRCAATHQRSTLQESAPKTTYSYGAYSVTVPDQKKWSNLQKKATAELAALEKLKRRNIGHVSITPRAVGGKLTQEEVRRRQQQNFSKAEIIQESYRRIGRRRMLFLFSRRAEISGQQSPKKET